MIHRPDPNATPCRIEEAARMVGGDEDDTGSYIAPPAFAIYPRFDWLGWTFVGSLLAAGVAALWIAWPS